MTIETFNSSTTWTCPVGVTSVQIECWGGGSTGGTGLYHYYLNYNRSGAGGGGGAYSKKNSFTVTPSSNYTVSVGTAGVQTYFNNVSTVLAKAGTTATGGPSPGGAAASGVGDIKYSGGNGGAMTAAPTGLSMDGASAGSSAGTGANGNNGSTKSTSNVTAPTGGGNGGGGGAAGSVGTAGSAPGGGGGGGGVMNANKAGGTGATGRIVLTYTAVTGGPFPFFISRAMRGGMIAMNGAL